MVFFSDQRGPNVVVLRPDPELAVDLKVKLDKHKIWCKKSGKPFPPAVTVQPTATEMEKFHEKKVAARMNQEMQQEYNQGPPGSIDVEDI